MRTLIAALVVTAASLLAAPAAEAQVTSFRGPGGGLATAGSLPLGTYFAPQNGWSYPYSPVTYGTAAAYDPALEVGPHAGTRAPVGLVEDDVVEVKDARLPGTVEERQENIRRAVIEALRGDPIGAPDGDHMTPASLVVP